MTLRALLHTGHKLATQFITSYLAIDDHYQLQKCKKVCLFFLEKPTEGVQVKENVLGEIKKPKTFWKREDI